MGRLILLQLEPCFAMAVQSIYTHVEEGNYVNELKVLFSQNVLRFRPYMLLV